MLVLSLLRQPLNSLISATTIVGFSLVPLVAHTMGFRENDFLFHGLSRFFIHLSNFLRKHP